MKSIINKIRNKRIEKGWSQENMAHELNISQAAYTKLENGLTKLSVERFLQLSQILGLAADELISIAGNMSADDQVTETRYADQAQNTLNELIDSYKNEIEFLKQLNQRLTELLKLNIKDIHILKTQYQKIKNKQ